MSSGVSTGNAHSPYRRLYHGRGVDPGITQGVRLFFSSPCAMTYAALSVSRKTRMRSSSSSNRLGRQAALTSVTKLPEKRLDSDRTEVDTPKTALWASAGND